MGASELAPELVECGATLRIGAAPFADQSGASRSSIRDGVENW
jgi:hypothetical protein